MKSIFHQVLARVRRFLWAFIVAYMVGMHNFYHGDNKFKDDIRITTEVNEAEESGSPKD